jgi:hypothetical protein
VNTDAILERYETPVEGPGVMQERALRRAVVLHWEHFMKQMAIPRSVDIRRHNKPCYCRSGMTHAGFFNSRAQMLESTSLEREDVQVAMT